MQARNRKIIFALSLLVAVLLLVVSMVGLNNGLYEWESPGWRIQCIGQDLVDLVFVLPVLLVSSLLLLRSITEGLLLWPGVMLHVLYTFTIYCFDVHFNAYFLEYCAILGLCLYGLAYFIFSMGQACQPLPYKTRALTVILAAYFLILGATFYLAWMSDIVKAIRLGNLPSKLYEMQLPTNPVHVLDIAALLPLFLITGILLLKRKAIALPLVPLEFRNTDKSHVRA